MRLLLLLLLCNISSLRNICLRRLLLLRTWHSCSWRRRSNLLLWLLGKICSLALHPLALDAPWIALHPWLSLL